MIDTLNSLAFRPWLLEEKTAAFFYAQLVNGKLDLTKLKQKADQKVLALYQGIPSQQIGTYVSTRKVKSKSGQSIAVMSVYGTLTKRGDLCSYGMRDYMNEIALINEMEDIAGIVLDMEGPGGTVDGTNEFGMAVKGSKKPVVVYGDNMVASADYWVASQARYIVGNKNNPTEFGSIGVLCVHEYWGKFIEENIGSVKIIRAPQSKDKAQVNPIEELTPELEKEIVADLKVLAANFISTVKKGRGEALKASDSDWGTGKMFKLDDCIDMGLIDAKGNLMDAINKAAEIGSAAPSAKKSSKSNATIKMNRQQVAEKTASLIMGKPVKVVAAEQPAAADSATPPLWTKDLIFNTDGSGDGAECLHPDADGVNHQWITKIDNNQGNEPPTDANITEDDNWLLDDDAAEGGDGGGAEEGTAAKVEAVKPAKPVKNAALISEQRKRKVAEAKVAELEAEKLANEGKPAAGKTTVVTGNEDGKKRKATSSWDKDACNKLGIPTE